MIFRQLHRRFAFLLAMAVLAVWPAISQAAEPYSLRGIRLGILLADFKIMPMAGRGALPDAMPLCSDDPGGATARALPGGPAIMLSQGEAAAGFVRCGVFRQTADGPAAAGFAVAGVETAPVFIFVPDSTGALRLAWIRVMAASGNYETIRAALLKRYGRPKTTMRGYAHDAAGAQLVDETVIWSNDTGSIRLEQRQEDVDVRSMSLDYSEEALTTEGLRRLNAVSSTHADLL